MSIAGHSIVKAIASIGAKLPVDVVEQMANLCQAHQPTDVRSRIADAIPHAGHRSLALAFVDDWLENFSNVSPLEIALALRTATHLERMKHLNQSVEMVWTGPNSEVIPYRHTEQAILQMLNSAQERILLVSYAVYSIPNIQDAVVRAAARGVRITVIVETPSKLDVENEYSTLRALGEDVAACSRLFYWPQQNRKMDDSGKYGILHVKCVVADGKQLLLSSANLTEYAFTLNMELGVLISGGRVPGQVESNFERLIEDEVLCEVLDR